MYNVHIHSIKIHIGVSFDDSKTNNLVNFDINDKQFC